MHTFYKMAFTDEKTGIFGNIDLIGDNPALIMNSRQSKTPVGNDPWIKNTFEAVRYCSENSIPVIASIGMNTWEFTLWAVGETGGNAIVLVPSCDKNNFDEAVKNIVDDFGLEFSSHAWVCLGTGSVKGKKWWHDRDRMAIEISRMIFPVSIRNGGYWDKFLLQNQAGKPIDDNFRLDYESGAKRKFKIASVTKCFPTSDRKYLTHWTSRSYHPWPGEKSADFYSAIYQSRDEYARSAENTLIRILEEGLIRGSGKRIRGGCPVVSFTSLAPDKALELMRWRKRFVRPTFEPFGVAITFETAEKLGIKPVVYVKSDEPVSGNQPEFQQGYGIGDWRLENEHRAIGDVDLEKIPRDEIAVLVPSVNSAEKIRERFGLKTIALIETAESD
ncbi:MAG TPA: hypothetical protein ENN67_02200 [Firmicutes bacterium]|nr:hypothetical protein [Bacillota bacterium]